MNGRRGRRIKPKNNVIRVPRVLWEMNSMAVKKIPPLMERIFVRKEKAGKESDALIQRANTLATKEKVDVDQISQMLKKVDRLSLRQLIDEFRIRIGSYRMMIHDLEIHNSQQRGDFLKIRNEWFTPLREEMDSINHLSREILDRHKDPQKTREYALAFISMSRTQRRKHQET